MASLFTSPPKPKTVQPVRTADAELARSRINKERRRAAGTYAQTILGSGLKTALGQ